jgi:hypothetical protein
VSAIENMMRGMIAAVADREPLLVVEGRHGQALGFVTAPSGDLMLVAVDRDGDTAALTLTGAGVDRVHRALGAWLADRETTS